MINNSKNENQNGAAEFVAKKHSSFGSAVHHFIWGPEVEFGDCVFYTILTLVLLGLFWLFTFERIGIGVEYSLIVWAVLVYFIWRERAKFKRESEGTANGNG